MGIGGAVTLDTAHIRCPMVGGRGLTKGVRGMSEWLIGVGGVLIGWGARDLYTHLFTWWVLREPDQQDTGRLLSPSGHVRVTGDQS